jgi:uncharacterized membrane protein required for colicin V production
LFHPAPVSRPEGFAAMMSLSQIVTLAVSLAVSIVVVMMTLGAFGVTSSIGRTIGFGFACAVGFVIGQFVHQRYVAR